MQRRELAQGLIAAATASGVGVSLDSMAQSGSGGPFPRTAAETSANVIPERLDFPEGDLRRYGGDPRGQSDSSNALQAAASVGRVVIPLGASFKILKGATRSGPISMTGFGHSSQLWCDSNVVTVMGGTGSVVDNFQMLNITEPWIITRDEKNWRGDVSKSLRRSNDDGYQPTINDGDIWSTLSPEQQSQQIGPSIFFKGNARDIVISRVYGRSVVLGLYDTQYSSVSDCSFKGGKGGTAAIFFWNINDQPGQFNKALRNTIRESSFSGIVFARNSDFQVQNNMCISCGESGIKTWQGLVAGRDSRCYRGQIQQNTCTMNYFDGIDAMCDPPNSDSIASYHQVQGNNCYRNGGDGINSNGQFNQITDNHLARNERFGLWGSGLSLSKISGNFCVDNNQSRNTSQHDISVVGATAGNLISDNWVWAGPGQNNYAIYAPGTNFVSGNHGVNGARMFIGKNLDSDGK